MGGAGVCRVSPGTLSGFECVQTASFPAVQHSSLCPICHLVLLGDLTEGGVPTGACARMYSLLVDSSLWAHVASGTLQPAAFTWCRWCDTHKACHMQPLQSLCLGLLCGGNQLNPTARVSSHTWTASCTALSSLQPVSSPTPAPVVPFPWQVSHRWPWHLRV